MGGLSNYQMEDYQIGDRMDRPFGVGLGRWVGRRSESRHLATYELRAGARVGTWEDSWVLAHGHYGESESIQVNPS